MSKQLSIETFPKPDTSFITIDKVFRYMKKCESVKETPKDPSTKIIRLAKDLARQKGPLLLDHNDNVRSILGTNISDDRIENVKPFKKLLFRTVIASVRYQNGRYIIKTKKVKRR